MASHCIWHLLTYWQMLFWTFRYYFSVSPVLGNHRESSWTFKIISRGLIMVLISSGMQEPGTIKKVFNLNLNSELNSNCIWIPPVIPTTLISHRVSPTKSLLTYFWNNANTFLKARGFWSDIFWMFYVSSWEVSWCFIN